MSQHTGSTPDTPRATDWRDASACQDEDGELFFPVGSSPPALAQTRHAKVICSGCPVLQECGTWALETRQASGVWGGMSERERANILRQKQRRNLDAAAVADKVDEARQPEKPRTLRSIFEDGTTRLYGGHLAWTGKRQVHFGGQTHTPKQVAFAVDRGHFPDGRVTSDCGIDECVLPSHLVDVTERALKRAALGSEALA